MKQIICGIDHPALAVSDVDAFAEWCCRMLDFEKVIRLDKPVWILRGPDGTLLEIMPEDGTPRPQRTTWTPGWSHLALRVEDIEQAGAALEQRGVIFAGPPAPAAGGGRVRNFYDPDGNLWQIIERPWTMEAKEAPSKSLRR